MDKHERIFWRMATAVFALFVGVVYYPVFFAKIPFPRDMVLQFPAWAGRIPPEMMRSYADIGDLITYFYPARAFVSQSVKEGILPLWNPLLISGEPFLANAQSSLFYPPNVLYYLLPLPVGWTLCLLLRMFLAELFMAIFIRSIGGSRAGAIFSGIVFASSGFMTAWQGQPMGDSAIWLPLVCYAVQRLLKFPSSTSIGIAAAAFAMPVLAGHPETAAHVTLTGTALALSAWVFAAEPNTRRFDRRFLFRFAAVGVLALGLASIQMIPTLEWLKEIGEVFNAVWPPQDSHQILGWLSRDIFRSPNSAGINIPEGAAYMAILSILAAPLAVFHRSRVHTSFLFVWTAFAIMVAYGVQPVFSLVAHVPVVGHVKNFRLLVSNFGVAALGGLGISILDEELAFMVKKRIAALGLLVSIFALVLALNHRLQLDTALKVEFTHRPSFSRTLLLVSFILLVWRLSGHLRRWPFQIAVCGLVFFDLATFGFGYMGFANRGEIFPASPAFDFLLHDDGPKFRVIDVGLPYSANAPVMYGLDSANGYEVGLTKLQRVFSQDLIDSNSNGISFVPDRILQNTDRRLDLLNLKYVVLPTFLPVLKQFAESDRFVQVFNNRDVAIFENKFVLPRVWIVPAPGIEILPDFEAQLNRLKDPGFDPMKRVILSKAPQQFLIPAALENDFIGTANIVENHPTSLLIKTQASMSAILVISQNYYPGWHATIDGDSADILAANIMLDGIPIAPGSHEVRLVFQPLSFRIGLGLTILSVIILLACLFRAQSA